MLITLISNFIHELDTSHSTIITKLGKQTMVSEFGPHWVPLLLAFYKTDYNLKKKIVLIFFFNRKRLSKYVLVFGHNFQLFIY